MRSFFITFFSNISNSCKRHKLLTVGLIIGIVISLVLGIVGGVQLNNSMFPQDFSNVSYVKFLKGSGFATFFFSLLFSILIFALIIFISCCRKIFIPIGILFFMYFVYAQTVTIISVSTEFGFFNTLILVVFLIIVSLIYFSLLLLLMVQCCDCSGPMYFRIALKSILPLLVCIALVVLVNVIFLMILKNFVIILVYD